MADRSFADREHWQTIARIVAEHLSSKALANVVKTDLC